VFARRGFRGATLGRVAAEAGVPRAALVAVFGDKPGLFLEVLGAGLAHQAATLKGLFDAAGDDGKALVGELGAFLDAMDGGSDLAILIILLHAEARRRPELRPRLAEVVAGYEAALATLLRRYFQVTGRAPPLPEARLPATILAIAMGTRLARGGATATPSASTGQLVRLLLRL
jgi:AcrR family transcriptional regulator